MWKWGTFWEQQKYEDALILLQKPKSLFLDIEARPYHANLAADRRTLVHKKWLSGAIQVVVATVAFGMGIDKVRNADNYNPI